MRFNMTILSSFFSRYNPARKPKFNLQTENLLETSAACGMNVESDNQQTYDSEAQSNYTRELLSRITTSAFSVNTMAQNQLDVALHGARCYTSTGKYLSTKPQFFTTHPGRSPTVNISWFIAKAHIANLYYNTGLRDHGATISTCNEIIQTYIQSKQTCLLSCRLLLFLLQSGVKYLTMKYNSCWDATHCAHMLLIKHLPLKVLCVSESALYCLLPI